MRHLFTEKKLVYQVITRRDPEAYGQLYDEYVAKIYRFIFFKVANKEEAEDVTSEVFLKTWHYLTERKPDEVTSFSGLIYRVARTCLVDLYRLKSQRNETLLESAENLTVHEERYREVELKDEARRILLVLNLMKREYQEVLLLRYVDDLSVREIATILQKTTTNVRVTIHRALKVAKDLLAKHKK